MAKLDTNKIPLELLIDYVEGLLDGESTTRLEAQLAQDEYHQNIVEGIRFFYAEKGQDRAALETYLDNFQERISPKEEAKIRKLPRSFLAIAASVALLVVAFFVIQNFQSPSSDDLFAQALSDPYPSVYSQNKSGDTQGIRASIGNLYQSGDYEGVIETTQALIDQDSAATTQDYFMLGIANLYQAGPNYSEAVKALKRAKELDTKSNISQQTDWYLALSYWGAGELENARRLLEEISKDSTHYKRDEALVFLGTT